MRSFFNFKKASGQGKLVLVACMVFAFGTPFLQTEIWAQSNTSAASSSQQELRDYEGVVLDSKTSEPLMGVTVQLKENATGTVTNMEGVFKIKASEGQVLTFTYIGYTPKEVKLDKLRLLNVEMVENSQELEQVVVTAFGVGQKKESVVGAISQIKAEDLRVPSANLTNSFAGRLAGVTAFQRSGEPGNDGSTFYIRGISTLSAAAQSALIIIDGVEASSGDLNALDPEVIEGFSILKDATATAMYGTRGANGVVIVTTKSGANLEKAVINARIEGYVSMPTKVPKFANAETYMNMYNEAAANLSTSGRTYSQDFINGVVSGANPYIYPNVDWYDELFKGAAFNQKVNFNIRGGSKRVDYFVNANFNHETGMLRSRSKEFYSYNNNINNIRYTFQNNINVYVTKRATITMNLGVELRDTHGPDKATNKLYESVMNTNPVDFPILFPMGSYVGSVGTVSDYIKWGIYDGGTASDNTNPLAELVGGYKDGFESTVRANLKWNQKLDFITPGLKFNALLSFKNWASSTDTRSRAYNKYMYSSTAPGGNYLLNVNGGTEVGTTMNTNRVVTGDRRIYFQASLMYDRTFKDVHNVSAMFLYNQDQYDGAYATSDLITTLPTRKQGIAARVSYDYAHRYLAEINMGYNGSENFAEGHRWGFFPSLALGWNISEEKWFEKAKNVIHNLKIRGSYGLVGNADSGTRFMYLPTLSLQARGFTTGDASNNWISRSGPSYTRFANNDITWETGYKTNIGIDLGLFNSLDLTLEYFNELRKDIYMTNNSVPQYMGATGTTIYGNYGEVKNHGFEMTATYGKQVNKDLSVEFRGTFSYAHNEVRKYAQGYHPDYPNKSIIGQSLNTNTGYVYAGHLFIDEAEVANSAVISGGNTGPGDIKYVDIPNKYGQTDGIINQYDQVYMGYPTTPEIIYGFGPSIKYKNWDFSFFFQGAARTSLMMSGFHPFSIENANKNRNVLQFVADDYWSVDNPNIYAKYPRLTQSAHSTNTAASSYWLRNAAFLKLKNAEIGFSWKFLRAYVSGSNLLTFSPFKYWDPEMGGGAGLKYPTQRVINFGVQMNFK